MSIKLIAVDLDGTLLNSEQKITLNTKLALQKAANRGIAIVPCSGRPFLGVKEYLEELGLNGNNQYAVTFNGALVFNLMGKEIVRELLSYKDFIYFQEISQKNNMPYHIEVEDRFITLWHELNIYLTHESWLTRMPIEIKEKNEINKNIVFTKAMFSGSPEEILNFQRKLPTSVYENYNVATSDPTLIEINSKRASKGNALLALAKVLKIEPSQVMIFGDQKNDLSMFDINDFKKVAMGNAIDEIKERADYVTKTNNEDGIAYALEKLVL